MKIAYASLFCCPSDFLVFNRRESFLHNIYIVIKIIIIVQIIINQMMRDIYAQKTHLFAFH
jgi:hypothetical protein